jgi:hypothetical protein
MSIAVDDPPAVLTWVLECIEPGLDQIGERKRVLASQASAVSRGGRFRITTSVTRRDFFDCYATGDGPTLGVRWEENGEDVTQRDAFFGEMIRLLIGSQRDDIHIQGLSPSDFENLKRWRMVDVLLDNDFTEAWPRMADDLGLVTVEFRKTISSGEVYESALEFSVDDASLKTLFAYLDKKGPDFESFEYRVSWHLAGGKVYREKAGWSRGDWGALVISWPLDVIRIEVETDQELAYSELIVEISCDQFDERQIEQAVVRSGSDVFTELVINCDKNAPTFYRLVATSQGGESYQTDTMPLRDQFIYVDANVFARD